MDFLVVSLIYPILINEGEVRNSNFSGIWKDYLGCNPKRRGRK